MGISEACSPINRKSMSRLPLSPGARSSPSRASDSASEQEPQRQRDQEQPPLETHVHVGVDPDPEPARDDAVGMMQRLADRIMGRNRRAESNDTFTNFPK